MIGNNRIREEEITTRKNILAKEKISSDERLWLRTHSVYNTFIGGDAFHEIVEKIPPTQWLNLRLKVESVSYNERIKPILIVPGDKGKIISELNLRDIYGRVKPPQTPVKMLGMEINGPNDERLLEYKSDLGLYSISYEFDCYDDRVKRVIPIYATSRNPKHALKREPIDDHTIRYYCKSPISDSFDALVFTVSWALNEELNKCKCK